MGVWHRARLRNFAETMPRAGNRPGRGVVRAACSLPSRQRRGRENGQHGPELDGCLTSMVRLRNAGRWERPDVWGQERDAPGHLTFIAIWHVLVRPASNVPARGCAASFGATAGAVQCLAGRDRMVRRCLLWPEQRRWLSVRAGRGRCRFAASGPNQCAGCWLRVRQTVASARPPAGAAAARWLKRHANGRACADRPMRSCPV